MELTTIFRDVKGMGLLDYVACWYKKTLGYMLAKPSIRAALVSTNSITQGEQVGVLWPSLLRGGIRIHFAHRTFQWYNEGSGKAAVHCVIVGFGLSNIAYKTIFEYKDIKSEPDAVVVNNINSYLVDAPDIILENRKSPISKVTALSCGSFALDDGNLILTPVDRSAILSKYPIADKYIFPYVGGREFLHNEPRYCLWLKDANPTDIRSMLPIKQRVEKVKAWRENSGRETTKKLAATPAIFAEIRQPSVDYLAIPTTSSENRLYIPAAFLPKTVIASNALYVLPSATLFHFAILSSIMHNSWMRYVCGRLESRYRYSASIVYNNYPWPEPTDKQRSAIEAAAQSVLNARAAHPDSSLASLYDPISMPANLVKAHNKLDQSVDAAYGYKGAPTDAARVAFLFELYQKLTSLLPAEKIVKRRRKTKV